MTKCVLQSFVLKLSTKRKAATLFCCCFLKRQTAYGTDRLFHPPFERRFHRPSIRQSSSSERYPTQQGSPNIVRNHQHHPASIYARKKRYRRHLLGWWPFLTPYYCPLETINQCIHSNKHPHPVPSTTKGVSLLCNPKVCVPI